MCILVVSQYFVLLFDWVWCVCLSVCVLCKSIQWGETIGSWTLSNKWFHKNWTKKERIHKLAFDAIQSRKNSIYFLFIFSHQDRRYFAISSLWNWSDGWIGKLSSRFSFICVVHLLFKLSEQRFERPTKTESYTKWIMIPLYHVVLCRVVTEIF